MFRHSASKPNPLSMNYDWWHISALIWKVPNSKLLSKELYSSIPDVQRLAGEWLNVLREQFSRLVQGRVGGTPSASKYTWYPGKETLQGWRALSSIHMWYLNIQLWLAGNTSLSL